MNNEVKKDDKLINHIRNVKLLQAIHSGKRFYVDCFPTDKDAICFPNSNRAVKEIELPNFDLFEEKQDYKWVNSNEPGAVSSHEAEKEVCCSHCGDPIEVPLCKNCEIALQMPDEEY